MRDSPWYIIALIVLIGGVMGYSFFTSELRSIKVTGKFVEDGRSRYGITSERFVIESEKGRYTILKFPLIGHAFDAQDVYDRIPIGETIEVRIGFFPPRVIHSTARPQIMAVY